MIWEGKIVKILLINIVCGVDSTGRICAEIAEDLISKGHEVCVAYGRGNVPEKYKDISKRIGNDFDVYVHALKARLFDSCGFESRKATEKFISWIKEWDPDIIHLHNIHGYYINVELLFNYLHECGKKIIWTLHDCWAFTGHCSYFTAVNCSKWKTGCNNCMQNMEYPTSICDKSERNYKKKKELFTGVNNLHIITPSNWLKELVSESFLKEYQVDVVYNKIDKSIFKKTESNFKERYSITDKRVILGVASHWDKRKGLEDFLALSQVLNHEYVIVVVGLTKKQTEDIQLSNVFIRKETDNPKIVKYESTGIISEPEMSETVKMPKVQKAAEIILESSSPETKLGEKEGVAAFFCVERTDNVQELAGLYSIADYLFNPTREDNYPTVNLEAEACGTPVITYDIGGCRETIYRNDSVCI